jgi:hypothetical protein
MIQNERRSSETHFISHKMPFSPVPLLTDQTKPDQPILLPYNNQEQRIAERIGLKAVRNAILSYEIRTLRAKVEKLKTMATPKRTEQPATFIVLPL